MKAQLPIDPGPANLGEVCGQVVEELEAFHPESTLRYACDGNLSGRWDAARIGQMVSNLAANTIQHGEPDAPVTITVRGEDDAVVLQVHNAAAQAAARQRPGRGIV